MTATQYENAKEMVADIQRLPVEAQKTIFNMVHGAIAICDLYTGMETPPQTARPSA